MGRLVATLGLVAALGAAVGCGSSAQAELPQPADDPVSVAIAYREGTVVCDTAHARRALSLVDGWTGYAPRDETTAARRAAACREGVAPETTIRAALVSQSARRAVVRVAAVAPDGGGVSELVVLRRHDGRWWVAG